MKTAWDCYTSGIVVTKTLTISKHYFLVMIGIGYFLLLLEFGRQGFNHFRSLREGD